MAKIGWVGDAPPAAVLAALKQQGHALEKGGAVDVRVVATREGRRAPARPIGDAPWIWLASGKVDDAAAREAVLAGAYEVLSIAEPDAARKLAARIAELGTKEPPPPTPSTTIVQSEVARKILAQVARAARTSMPVLLTGETGTGKEVTARLLHAWSARRERPFIPINCAAIPNELMEGELFGYAKGAFSGAVKAYDGNLMAAEGGSVFLDEIDDTPPSIQAKLLRVLEDRVVSRLGENVWHQVDFRILAATNRDLKQLIAKGQFGDDLYERLAIVHIHLPPLRERVDDVPALAEFFMARFFREEPDARSRAPVTRVTPAALRALQAYPWPGNIRELRNAIFEALVYKRSGEELLLSDLPRRLLQREAGPAPAGSLVDAAALRKRLDEGKFNLRSEIEQLERLALEEALARAGGSAAGAARLLGEVGRGSARDPGGTVRAMVRRLGLRAR